MWVKLDAAAYAGKLAELALALGIEASALDPQLTPEEARRQVEAALVGMLIDAAHAQVQGKNVVRSPMRSESVAP